MKKTEVKVLRDKEWQIREDLVLKEEKIYVLKNKKLRIEIIQLYYNIPVAGHGDRYKTIELVIRNYWWPRMTKNVGKYIDKYNLS